jgi:hypothetical protein
MRGSEAYGATALFGILGWRESGNWQRETEFGNQDKIGWLISFVIWCYGISVALWNGKRMEANTEIHATSIVQV